MDWTWENQKPEYRIVQQSISIFHEPEGRIAIKHQKSTRNSTTISVLLIQFRV